VQRSHRIEKAHGLKLVKCRKNMGMEQSGGPIQGRAPGAILIDLGQIKPGDKVSKSDAGRHFYKKSIFIDESGPYRQSTSPNAAKSVREYEVFLFALTALPMDMDFRDRAFDVFFGSSVFSPPCTKKSVQRNIPRTKSPQADHFRRTKYVESAIFFQKNIPFIKLRLGDSPNETALFVVNKKSWWSRASKKRN